MPQGTVKKVISEKGFGFIEGERGDIFFHHTALVGTTIENLQEGQLVGVRRRKWTQGSTSRKRKACLKN